MAIELRVSEKGCVSVYGLRRFPISLYPDEWRIIFDEASKIEAFIVANAGDLKPAIDKELSPRRNSDGKSFSQLMGWQR